MVVHNILPANRLAARQVVAEIEAQGGKALALQADVADEAQVMAMFRALDVRVEEQDGSVQEFKVVYRKYSLSDTPWYGAFQIRG
ncbi:hypothetical protein ISX56_34615, partial [Serratia ureilytica]|nr:hypothetical protein [Serratia ureilytica]